MALLALVPWLAACTCYHVTDTRSGKEFYTKKVERSESGAPEFVDMATGARVTVESAVIAEVSCSAARRAIYEDEKARSRLGGG